MCESFLRNAKHVPGCKRNYTMLISTDNIQGKKWISAFPRKHFNPIKHTGVCESCFQKEDVITFITEQETKNGKSLLQD